MLSLSTDHFLHYFIISNYYNNRIGRSKNIPPPESTEGGFVKPPPEEPKEDSVNNISIHIMMKLQMVDLLQKNHQMNR